MYRYWEKDFTVYENNDSKARTSVTYSTAQDMTSGDYCYSLSSVKKVNKNIAMGVTKKKKKIKIHSALLAI